MFRLHRSITPFALQTWISMFRKSSPVFCLLFFFFNDTATTEIYTLSLHDALPISSTPCSTSPSPPTVRTAWGCAVRSEEHTSELQSRVDLVCRLLLEKKKSQT